MSNDLVKTINPFDMALNDVDTTQRLCAKLMQSKHYQKMGEEGIYAIVTKAKSLGIDPIEALGGSLYYLQGKVGMSTEMMASLIRQKGHSISKDAKSDNTRCILHGKRADTGDTWTVTFTLDDAKRAGLMKNMYEKYPQIMIYNRAMSMLARQLFPDIIKGAGYDMGELREISKFNSDELDPSPDVKVFKQFITPEQCAELTTLLGVCSVEYQDQVLNSLKKLPEPVLSLYELPVDLFDRIKLAAIKNAKKPDQIVEEIIDATETV